MGFQPPKLSIYAGALTVSGRPQDPVALVRVIGVLFPVP